jgi:hypothetical protein
MTDVMKSQTENWKTIPWKKIQRNVFRLQKRIYRAKRMVLMSTALVLRSRVLGNPQARFCSGGGGGDVPADHNFGPVQTAS